MHSIKSFKTESLDLATYLVCLGNQLTIDPPLSGTRVLFSFVETPTLIHSIIGYERGANDSKKLLTTRARLYREATAIAKGGKNGN